MSKNLELDEICRRFCVDGNTAWMIRQNVEYAGRDGLQPVLKNLLMLGYGRIAKYVQEIVKERECSSGENGSSS